MPCTPFTRPGGGSGILCTRTRRPRCACGQPATLQCDAPTPGKLISSGPNAGRVRKPGTCDRHLCERCATEVGPDKHVCQQHATSGFATANEPAKTDMPTRQEALF